MKKKKSNLLALAVSAGLMVVALLLFAGCVSTVSSTPKAASAAAGNDSDTGKGGSQLWAESCARCHNIRSPSSYSDVEWQVAMHHMRIRANLTAEEHQKILEFLRSAN